MAAPAVLGFLTCVIAIASVQGQRNDPCMKIMQCFTSDLDKATRDGDVDAICRLGPQYVKCLEDSIPLCKDDRKASMANSQLDIFRGQLQRCSGHQQTTIKYTGKESCAEAFDQCLTPSVKQAAEHDDVEELCRHGPGVISCMENVLQTACKELSQSQPDKAKMLQKQIDQMERRFSTCDKNSGDLLITSLSLTCVSLLVALLLHRI